MSAAQVTAFAIAAQAQACEIDAHHRAVQHRVFLDDADAGIARRLRAKASAGQQERSCHRGQRGAMFHSITRSARSAIRCGIVMPVRGTRIPVELLLRMLAGGAPGQTLIEAYPQLTPAGIRAALACAAEALSLEHAEPRAV